MPPHGVAFSWHLRPRHDKPDWQYDADMPGASHVYAQFKAEGPDATLVELVHSELDRHGEGHMKLRALFDGPGAWSGILASYAEILKGKEVQ